MKQNKEKENINIEIYINAIAILVALILIVLSFCPSIGNTWANLFRDIGIGILPAGFIAFIICRANDRQAEKKRKYIRQTLLRQVLRMIRYIYKEYIYKINEYACEGNVDWEPIQSLYRPSGMQLFNQFLHNLKKIEYSEVSNEQKERLNRLFRVNSLNFGFIYQKLTPLIDDSYYIQGIITEDEFAELHKENGLELNLLKYPGY